MMLKAIATKYDLSVFPGWLEFYFVDANGKTHQLHEKLPVLGIAYPKNEHEVPFEFELKYEVLDGSEDEVLNIRLLHGISDALANSCFQISKAI